MSEDRGPALVCYGLSRPTEFENISFEPRKDEILLFHGLVGTGGSTVLQALTVVTKRSRSAITLAAKTVAPKSSADPIKLGIVYVASLSTSHHSPHNRREHGRGALGGRVAWLFGVPHMAVTLGTLAISSIST